MKTKLIYLAIAVFGVVAYLFVYFLLLDGEKKLIASSKEMLIHEASSHYQNISMLKLWHDKFGGIYADKNASNENYKFEIKSLNPKNPENIAIGFSKEALEYFIANPTRSTYQRFSDDDTNVKFMGVLRAQEYCIGCHAGYKVGDVRGGIEVFVPHDTYTQSVKEIKTRYRLYYIMVLLFGVISVGVILLLVRSVIAKQQLIEAANRTLENKVAIRTRELQKMYNQEHYIKSLLKTVSEVNESLISSFSLESIFKNSLEHLTHHRFYKFITYGQIENQKLYIRYKEGDIYNLITKEVYRLDDARDDITESMLETLRTAKVVATSNIGSDSFSRGNTRTSDYTIGSSISFPIIDESSALMFGILTIYNENKEFEAEEVGLLEAMVHDISMALSAFKQKTLVEKLQLEQISNYEETILAFVDMIEQRDAYTAGHTLRVARYCRLIAEQEGIEEEQIKKLEKAAILHDIGKIATPDTILLKPGRLTSLEYDLIKNHVTAGYRMLGKIELYKELAEIMKYHHEKYDGTGYPHGYRDVEIPVLSHILIIADAFDAMTTNRIYKSRKTTREAIDELVAGSGTQFHPKLIQIAQTALANVIVEHTTQLPNSVLEQKRFSYFFSDSLTGLHNEQYLEVLINGSSETYHHLCKLELKGFTQYNKTNGWNSGNQFLISFAKLLEKLTPNRHLLFRYHGDDFVVLGEEAIEIDEQALGDLVASARGLSLKITHHKTDNLKEVKF